MDYVENYKFCSEKTNYSYTCFKGIFYRNLVPDFEEGVPRAGADRHTVLGDAEAGHAVVVAHQHT